MVSKNEILDLAFKNHRVCPQPTHWNDLFHILSSKAQNMGVEKPAVPLILAAWHYSSDFSKAERMFHHIEWATDNSCSDSIHNFLSGLTESDWHHEVPYAEGDTSIETGPGFLIFRKIDDKDSI